MNLQDVWVRTEKCKAPASVDASYIAASITFKDAQHGHLTIARGHALRFDPQHEVQIRDAAIMAMMMNLDDCKRDCLPDVNHATFPTSSAVGGARGVAPGGLEASVHGYGCKTFFQKR